MPLVARLTKRRDYLAANRGRRVVTPHFILLSHALSSSRARGDGVQGDEPGVRAGITVTKKVGNAVTRNRIKRRLRALIRQILPRLARPGCDYVMIARRTVATSPFGELRTSFEKALTRSAGLHRS